MTFNRRPSADRAWAPLDLPPHARPGTRLIGITIPLVVVLTLAGVLVAYRDYQGRRTAVLADTSLLARAAGADADRFLRDRLDALTIIADSPPVHEANVPAMRDYFKDLADQPTLTRLSWFDLTGIRRASNLADPPTGPLNVNGRDYYKAVLATQRPYVDAAVISLQDGSPIITVATPTFTADGHLTGVLVNPILLRELEEALAAFRVRSSASVVAVDRAGQVIADADPATGILPLLNLQLLTQARAEGSGVVSGVTGPLGNPDRLVGFAGAPSGQWVVFVTRSAAEAFGPLHDALIAELITLLGVAAVGILGALLTGRRLDRDARVREQAQKATTRLASLVESSQDAIIGQDQSGAIESWNAAAERIFGYSADEVRGRPVTDLLMPERRATLRPALAALQDGQGVDEFETVGQRKDGSAIQLALTLSPIVGHGHSGGASTIARDITAHKHAEAERDELLVREQEARQAAEAANRARDEFLSVVSHELRTPLTAIVGFSQLLRRSRLTDEASLHMVDTIERNARVQVRLVNDLLDLSRVITGKLQLDLHPLSLVEVAEEAAAAARPGAESKHIILEVTTVEDRLTVSGDPDRLQQVIANLLANAVKFTPEGGHVALTVERDGSEARLTVRDDGIGIAAEFLPHVFERFRQADSSRSRAYSGLGLGLAIAHTLVDLHGGQITVASEGPATGTTVSVRLPLTAAETAPNAPPAATAESRPPAFPVLAGRRLLLVEDEDDTREMLRLTLEAEGAAVVAVASAADALAAFEAAAPDILISDIGMRFEDGYGLLRSIRSRGAERGGAVPAIALTAFAGAADRRRAFAAGFNRHLVKPLQGNELIGAIVELSRVDPSVARTGSTGR